MKKFYSKPECKVWKAIINSVICESSNIEEYSGRSFNWESEGYLSE